MQNVTFEPVVLLTKCEEYQKAIADLDEAIGLNPRRRNTSTSAGLPF